MKHTPTSTDTAMMSHSSLFKRFLTALVLTPIVVFLVLFIPTEWFALVCGIVFLMAAFEWTKLSGFESTLGRALGVIAIPLIFAGFLMALRVFTQPQYLLLQNPEEGLGPQYARSEVLERILQLVIVGGWCLAALLVMIFPKGKAYYQSKIMGLVIGALVLAPPFSSLILLHKINPDLALYPLVLVWVADIAAYFAGKRFGRHALAPAVSSGKTWEGVIGALLGACVVAALGYYFFDIHKAFVYWLLFNLIIVLFSIVGDLFESVFKRIRNLKDSGQLLPGHGGLLDRIDSLTAAIPLFAIGLMFFG